MKVSAFLKTQTVQCKRINVRDAVNTNHIEKNYFAKYYRLVKSQLIDLFGVFEVNFKWVNLGKLC